MTSNTLSDRPTISVIGKGQDFVALAKPRISLMVLLSVAVSGVISCTGPVPVWTLFHAMVGLALISASGCALNQYLERYVDWLMPRTAQRPLPDQRLSATEVTSFGSITFGIGAAYLFMLVNWQTGLVALLSWTIYVWIYTPLKTVTWFNTHVGAIAGAMPILVGSTATTGYITGDAWMLFAVLFMWQFPHFMAIAWLYREDYRQADLHMVSVGAGARRRTAQQAVVFAVLLIPLTLTSVGWETWLNGLWLTVVGCLGGWYLLAAVRFARKTNDATARGLFRVSLLYLPAFLIVLTLSKLL